MEPKSLPSEDAQIQRRAQGSVSSVLLGMAETINTLSPFQTSQTLSLCLLEHGHFL